MVRNQTPLGQGCYNWCMLITSDQVDGAQVLSLHVGRPVATVTKPIIDPRKLQIVGFFVDHTGPEKDAVLLTQDIREVAAGRLLINSADEITAADQLFRLQDVLELDFVLEGKRVVTDNQRKVGTVKHYVAETDTFLIQKLYVRPPVLRSLMVDNAIVNRQQIIEVTDKKIIVADSVIREGAFAKQPVPGV